jgi:hypothetical protein
MVTEIGFQHVNSVDLVQQIAQQKGSSYYGEISHFLKGREFLD